MYSSKDGTKLTTAYGTKLGQVTPSTIKTRSGVNLDRPLGKNMKSANTRKDATSNLTSGRKSKFPLLNQESFIASFKDF